MQFYGNATSLEGFQPQHMIKRKAVYLGLDRIIPDIRCNIMTATLYVLS